MALNNSNCGSGIIIFYGERLLIYYDHCDIKFENYGHNDIFKNSKSGSVYLTSHRVVFINKNLSDRLQSLSMPFVALKGVDIKQPVFGANRIEGNLTSEPNGGFQGSIHFSITFKHGGAIEFGEALLEAGRRATRGHPAWCPADNFFSIPVGAQYYAAPPPAYAPPYYDSYYNFVPQHESFVQANGAQVFMYGNPPPYPGACPYPINPQTGVMPQPQAANPYPNNTSKHHNTNFSSSSSSCYLSTLDKEYEANQQQLPGYYSVEDPHTVYVAQNGQCPSYESTVPTAPPAYSDINKKNN